MLKSLNDLPDGCSINDIPGFVEDKYDAVFEEIMDDCGRFGIDSQSLLEIWREQMPVWVVKNQKRLVPDLFKWIKDKFGYE